MGVGTLALTPSLDIYLFIIIDTLLGSKSVYKHRTPFGW